MIRDGYVYGNGWGRPATSEELAAHAAETAMRAAERAGPSWDDVRLYLEGLMQGPGVPCIVTLSERGIRRETPEQFHARRDRELSGEDPPSDPSWMLL